MKEEKINKWGRIATWCLSMSIVNLVFAELYFFNGGANWKFWTSDVLGVVCLLGVWFCTENMKEIDKGE